MAAMNEQKSVYVHRSLIVDFFRWILEIIFQAASLIIDTIRTFYLIVLSILGPLVFAISVFDGFQNSMVQWFAKYISVYLWLPISDLFGGILAKIQTLSLQKDISLMQNDPFYFFDTSNLMYLVFLLIGIVGYFTIPSIANWVVAASGFGTYNRKLSKVSNSVTNTVSAVAGATTGNTWGRIMGNMKK